MLLLPQPWTYRSTPALGHLLCSRTCHRDGHPGQRWLRCPIFRPQHLPPTPSQGFVSVKTQILHQTQELRLLVQPQTYRKIRNFGERSPGHAGSVNSWESAVRSAQALINALASKSRKTYKFCKNASTRHISASANPSPSPRLRRFPPLHPPAPQKGRFWCRFTLFLLKPREIHPLAGCCGVFGRDGEGFLAQGRDRRLGYLDETELGAEPGGFQNKIKN